MTLGELQPVPSPSELRKFLLPPPVVPEYANRKIRSLKHAQARIIANAIDMNSENTLFLTGRLQQQVSYISQEFGLGEHLGVQGIPVFISNPISSSDNDHDKSLAEELPFIFDEFTEQQHSEWSFHAIRREAKQYNRRKS